MRAIASTTDLECNYNCFGTPRLICCNGNIILPLASQAPHDKIIVLVSNNEYGGSGSVNFAVAYHRFPQYGPQVAIHEFSHSFALLGDEYSFGPNNGGNPLRANCDDNASCPRWNGMPGTSCIPGCTYNEWYRATNGLSDAAHPQRAGQRRLLPGLPRHYRRLPGAFQRRLVGHRLRWGNRCVGYHPRGSRLERFCAEWQL
ncbi:MAG: hypothetical protein IPO15_24460 [Anaerolineae bacterium]|nr:hypothetical protein [Anaerolineae bacterium]